MTDVTIILVEPQYTGNIGSIARAMKNFGLSKLVLVNPVRLDENAYYMAVHAKDVLKSAKIVDNFESEIKNYNLLIGTSAKRTKKDDKFLRICLSPEEMREKLSSANGKIAIVFGREDIGLTNEQLGLCDFIVAIPTSDKYKTMNLSHSAAIIFYELFRTKEKSKIRVANEKEKTLLMSQVNSVLTKLEYPKEKLSLHNLMIKKILGRAVITGREANSLIGIVKKINKKLPKNYK